VYPRHEEKRRREEAKSTLLFSSLPKEGRKEA